LLEGEEESLKVEGGGAMLAFLEGLRRKRKENRSLRTVMRGWNAMKTVDRKNQEHESDEMESEEGKGGG
jgi:hypothetical protein